ncbi:MAG: 30S ribosomal protein S2 [Anaerolineae bacterium]|nr:30S ribosomal protein S2 [Anaerolineae bacterium]
MAVVTMRELLEAGTHFGHRAQRWNPKMRRYIFRERNGIHIIDLQQTMRRLEEAYEAVRDRVSQGGIVLFVGTKKQAQQSIQEEAQRCGMPYVNQRWLGGMLTNFRTIRQRADYLIDLEQQAERGEFENLPKKEALQLRRLIEKLNRRLGGIRDLRRLPDMLFIADVRREALAVSEAKRLNIPIVGLVDTNSDPDPIDYCIPGNDDAIRSIRLMASKIADAVIEGQRMREVVEAKAEEFEETPIEELLGPSVLAKLRSGLPFEEEEAIAGELEAEEEAGEEEEEVADEEYEFGDEDEED